MTLADAQVGQWLVILGYDGGQGLSDRLYPLGLAPGDSARVIRRGPLGGALLIEAGGRSIAIGRSVARRVLVETSPPDLAGNGEGESANPKAQAGQGKSGDHGCDSHS